MTRVATRNRKGQMIGADPETRTVIRSAKSSSASGLGTK
jgi:hypothetical protein